MNLDETLPMFRNLRWINAYRAKLSEDLVQDLIRCDPQVGLVEPDIEVRPNLEEEIRSVPRRPASNVEVDKNVKNVRKWQTLVNFRRLKWWNKMIVAGRKMSICVASCDRDYRMSRFSNYGTNDIRIFAPGEGIQSGTNESDTAYDFFDGTSYAAPAVAAAMSIWVSFEKITNNVPRVWARMNSNQLVGVIDANPPRNIARNALVSTGINNPRRRFNTPYVDAPTNSVP
ncbi:MAG: hypothetical protein Q9160_007288 [Pyrenula sp. 1 TL-2023]